MIQNFIYNTPTRVVFGADSVKSVGTLAKEFGATKVLLHYGSERVQKNGLMKTIREALDQEGIAHVELGGVVPNPRLSKVYEGIALAEKEGVDFLIAVGGGSVVDSLKAIGYGLANGGDVWDFYDFKRKPAACMPLGVVLTISAAGSEMSNSSVITKDGLPGIAGIKRGCNTEFCRAKFAVMDPNLTMTLPEYQTMSGATDIMMHTLERYLSSGGHMELTDELAEGLLRTGMHNAKILLDDPQNYEARAEVMWASSLSHNGLTGCGTDGGDWACHRLEHELGGLYDVAHGAGLAAVWGTWARYVCKNDPARFRKLSVKVLGIPDEGPDDEVIEKGICAMEDFFRSIHMPTSLLELGVDPTEEEYKLLAKNCAAATGNNLGSVRKLHEEDMEAIFRAAR